MSWKAFLRIIVLLLQIAGIVLGASKNQCLGYVSITVAILLVIYSAISELELQRILEETDKEFQIERNCKGEITSHAKIDCGTYDSDNEVNQDNHENE